jgi:hypothetical protein
MADRWVVNASPVILLGKAGVIHLLPALCDELVVPAGVVAEVQQGRMADAGPHGSPETEGNSFARHRRSTRRWRCETAAPARPR